MIAVHLADRMALPAPYTVRPYRGRADHAAMCEILADHKLHGGGTGLPTLGQIDAAYGNLTSCDPTRDLAPIEAEGQPVAFVRTQRADLCDGSVDVGWFLPTVVRHAGNTELYGAFVDAIEAHVGSRVDDTEQARFRTYVPHPGPGRAPTGAAAVLTDRGHDILTWTAIMVRPALDDIPDRRLPDGVEVRPVTDEQVRPILEAHGEAFRGSWDFTEPTREEIDARIADPYHDPSMWKVAWAGDEIVGQVKSYINVATNGQLGIRRGHSENIATHHEWRNRGVDGALPAMSLRELRDRGMTEAALNVDNGNPGGALHLYSRVGFEPVGHLAVYVEPVS